MQMNDDKFLMEKVIHNLKYYLPSQAPLKDFIHHNTLHAFQEYDFHDALTRANKIFGYKTYLQVFLPKENRNDWWNKLLNNKNDENTSSSWKILNFKYVFYISGSSVFAGIILLLFRDSINEKYRFNLPIFFSLIGLLIVIKAFTERDSVRKSWTLIALNHIAIAIAISFNEHFEFIHQVWYLSGIAGSWLGGLLLINRLRKLEWVSLDRFYGRVYEHPKIGFWFLFCSLGLVGFPITPSFIGDYLIFSHIHSNQIGLAFFTALSLIINGLATIRIYARIFLGPHVKNYHEVAKRSS